MLSTFNISKGARTRHGNQLDLVKHIVPAQANLAEANLASLIIGWSANAESSTTV
jgi:hypothetical protein